MGAGVVVSSSQIRVGNGVRVTRVGNSTVGKSAQVGRAPNVVGVGMGVMLASGVICQEDRVDMGVCQGVGEGEGVQVA